jgi:hypothetical protein
MRKLLLSLIGCLVAAGETAAWPHGRARFGCLLRCYTRCSPDAGAGRQPAAASGPVNENWG